YNMGRAYTGGLWFDTDLVEAYKWYLLASDAEPERCREPLAALQLSLSPDDLAKAKSLAAEFRLRRDSKIKHPLPN
ncbi:MAG TPA: hypothetical protein VN673_15360, partial [Clostridia bacterium]|nr:hypothetical protein [Clostridia bacterium]